jgi:phage tail-like protein
MPTGKRKDPYLNFRFRVEIEGVTVGGFSEVSGFQVDTELETYREGGLNEYTHQFTKGSKFSNLTLKRGLIDFDLWDWHQNVVEGKIKRMSINIHQLNPKGENLRSWQFLGAYPVKWSGTELKADGNAVVLETLEFVHQGFKKS